MEIFQICLFADSKVIFQFVLSATTLLSREKKRRRLSEDET